MRLGVGKTFPASCALLGLILSLSSTSDKGILLGSSIKSYGCSEGVVKFFLSLVKYPSAKFASCSSFLLPKSNSVGDFTGNTLS
jgi:hypothetical protein